MVGFTLGVFLYIYLKHVAEVECLRFLISLFKGLCAELLSRCHLHYSSLAMGWKLWLPFIGALQSTRPKAPINKQTDYRIGFDDVFCVFRRREHQATERGITSLTPCAGGVVGRPSTSRSTSVHSVATQLQRCALVSVTPKPHTVKALNVP